MTDTDRAALIRVLPYARRYARAVAGNQVRGDAVVAEALRTVLAGPESGRLAVDAEARHALYAAVSRAGLALPAEADAAGVSQAQRMLLLLTSLEGLPPEQAYRVLDLGAGEGAALLAEARDRLRLNAETAVLIIEDEPIIAMDIQALVEDCGHRVVGIAASEEEAVALAELERPGLLLADINLGAGGDGTTAVARILERHAMPVIFVTAYPERLLTGEAVEPAFVITKPFEPMTLAVATYQAVTRGVKLT